MIRVFVSSTSEDLQDYRAVARNVILDKDWHPVMMEHFGASPRQTVDACCQKLAECDVVLLLVAFRRGWVPTKEQGGNGRDSITASEIAFARERGIPVLAMLASETWPGNLWEEESEARAWVKQFRADLNLPATFFDYEQPVSPEAERLPAFRAKVRELLTKYTEELRAKHDAGSSPVSEREYIDHATESIISGRSVLFLGPAIFGTGPLSPIELARDLVVDAENEQSLLPTAAEYRERRINDRVQFLEKFRHAIRDQSRRVEAPPSCHDLVASMEPPWFVVSATCDLVLEERLREEGKSPLIVSHIVHSHDAEHDGKILLIRPDGSSEICMANEVELGHAERILYKPLGSPLLDQRLDTLVVTETDHVTFLGRLENQATKIPNSLIRCFKHRTLLFLGYPLDVWHYRLVIQVFQMLGVPDSRSSILSVREPASEMEKLAWRRLGADLIQMDPNDFATRVLEELRVSPGDK